MRLHEAAGANRLSRVNFVAAAVVTLAAAVGPAVLWIGDVGFMQDEPRLLAKAYHANQRGGIETFGLNGNFGVPYGPLPTQIYQILLLLTHDPVVLAGLRAALCAGATAAGLVWLARSLRLNPWFATALVLAPYLWNFQRILWDASFAIPFGTLAVAGYASHLRTDSGKSLLLAVACGIAMLFIHPQDLPVVAPLFLHMLWRRRPSLARNYVGLAVVLGVALALNVGYFREVYYAVRWHVEHGSMKTTYDNKPSRAASFLTPLHGGSLFSGQRFAEQDSRLSEPKHVLDLAKKTSLVAYPLIWAGIGVIAVRCLLRRFRYAGDGELDDPRDPTLAFARRAIFGIALAGLVFHVLLYGLMRIPPEPQYFFGTFILQVVFAWAAVDALRRIYLDWVVIGAYGLAVGYLTIASMLHIHRHGYDRAFPRPTLANQAQVARDLNRYADPVVVTDADQYIAHPQAIRALRLLVRPTPGQTQLTGKRLAIRYRSGPDGKDAAIEVVELPDGSDPGPRFKPLDVTPLPPNWHPPVPEPLGVVE